MVRSPRRRFVPLVAALLVACGGLTACGDDGPTKAEIESQINANPGAGVVDPIEAAQVRTQRQQEDEDRRAAADAQRRRRTLDRLDRVQKQETDRILRGADDADGQSPVPFSEGDPEIDEFRARLSGVCEGTQRRLGKVADASAKAADKRDPKAILNAAADYTDTLGDFQSALNRLDAPPKIRDDYRAWLDTIDSLAATVRVTLVTTTDRETRARIQRRLSRLTTRFLEQTAGLGVTCVSIVT